MMALVWAAASLAAAIHVLIFAMESLWFRRPAVHRRFGVKGDLPETTRLFAFNQGFYNFFLAIGMGLGLGLVSQGHRPEGLLLIGWNAASMLAAALVLAGSSPRLWRAAVIQGGPPLVALLGLVAAF